MNSPYVVAILGRPNVGKSTLFNRIVGGREAIVHDMPGVTRDRNYADAEWAGKHFTLIDTGGYLPDAKDEVTVAIREQAKIALEEADAVILVVDAIEGMTSLDQEIAVILRKSSKKVLLVANKVDGEKREPDVAQFYKLGLGDPVALSAILGRKIGDFLDVLTEEISTNGKVESDVRLKLAIVGKPNVGKSSLVNSLVGEERSIVTPIPGTTRDSIDTVLRYYGEEILLVDTAGLRRRSRVKESIEFYSAIRTVKSVERSNVVVMMVDAVQGIDKQDLRIINDIAERKRATILAVNKWDLIEKDEHTARKFEKEIKYMLRMYDYIPVIFISAKTRQRTFKLIDVAKSVYAESTKRIPTHELNETLLGDIGSQPPSSVSGKEIKIKYVSQVLANPPAFSFFVNDPKLVQDSYKRFLERKIREHYRFTGVPIALFFRRKSR